MRWLLKNIEGTNTIWRDSHMYSNKVVHMEASLHFALYCVLSYGTFSPIIGSKTHKEINFLSIEILFIDHIHDWSFWQDKKKTALQRRDLCLGLQRVLVEWVNLVFWAN